jgi:predicted SAM-dependent methyltransferase
MRNDRPLVKRYLSQNAIRKLHIGCGGNVLDGWLNADYDPHSETILRLDAAHQFPLDNDTFDYVFSEHVIEHIPYSQGVLMLAECFRILREHGTIRISTPDLSFLIDLHKGKKSHLQKRYVKWATDNFIKGAPYYDDAFVINNFVRDWGHLFIYDEKTLRSSLNKAGFTRVTRCDLSQSTDAALRNLENEKRMPKGFLRLETFTLEGRKVVGKLSKRSA